MNFGLAKAVARRWVKAEGGKTPDFCGALYHGSAAWLPDSAVHPPSSDLDVMVVLDGPGPREKVGKIRYRDVLLDISYLSSDRIASPDRVLGDYHLAGSFRGPGIISDPSGRLVQLQAAVARDYAKRWWVRKRCEHARNHAVSCLNALKESDPLHDQVTAWLFAAGVTTHLLLTAGLRNPTVRRRYVAVRELLLDYSRLDSYETLLKMLGCAQISRDSAEQHLAALAEASDATTAVAKTRFPFSADLTAVARPIAIDGSRELIERGDHREALFWTVATYSRCQKVLYHDASIEVQERFGRSYRRTARRSGHFWLCGSPAPQCRHQGLSSQTLGCGGIHHGGKPGDRRRANEPSILSAAKALFSSAG